MNIEDERHCVDSYGPDTDAKPMRSILPRLRKNQRLEKRWGDTYYAIVKEAVFTQHTATYTPAEPPPSLRNETDDCQPLYVCGQCRDCFRFLSSFEAHNSRRSWILGYWCHNCYFTDCCHVPKDQLPCFDCQTMQRQRKSSLRAKGLRKGRKLGAIQIFHNQCQFFAHLKAHQTIVVDMADIMLMPMPMDVDKECYAQLDRLSANIMERMFLTRTHIMDWLGSQQLGNKWWKLLQASPKNDEDPLEEIFAATAVRSRKRSAKHLGKSQKTTVTGSESPVVLSSGSVFAPRYSSFETPQFSSISETIESVVAQSGGSETVSPPKMKKPETSLQSSITFIDSLESVENDDNPCTTADIAFVDCGPAANTYPPDVAILLPPKDKLTIIPKTSTSSSTVVMPAKTDSYPSFRACGAPQKLIHLQGNKIHSTTSVSAASPGNQWLFEPKISVKNFANELLKTPAAVPCQKNDSRFTNQRPQRLRKLAPASAVRITSASAPLSSSKKIVRAVEMSKKSGTQGSLTTSGPRILTVHSPKNVDLSKIISQLPPDVINGKKIVFIGQDAEPLTILPKNEAISFGRGMIKIQSESDKPKIFHTLPTKAASNFGNEKSVRIVSETSKMDPQTDKSNPKHQQVFLDGKVIYRNGKKFVIHHTRKPVPDTKICNSSNTFKLQAIPKPVSLTSFLSKPRNSVTSYRPIAAKPVDIGTTKVSSTFTASVTSPASSPPPPISPSPSTSGDPKGPTSIMQKNTNGNDSTNLEESHLPTSSSPSVTSMCNSTHDPDGVEYFSVKHYSAGKMYVDFSSPKGRSWTKIPGNHKQKLLQHLCGLSERRIREHIDHLRSTNSEYSSMLEVQVDARITENLTAIKEAEAVLTNRLLCPHEAEGENDAPSDDDFDDILSRSEETRKPLSTCPTCNKPAKPKSHIAGFSEDSATNLNCCSCNNYICHICGLFQGNMFRFGAHLSFHAKTEPFTCPECFKRFTSFDLLETHVWTTCFHPLARRWFRCRVCQFEGFLDMESLTKHFVLAHSTSRIGCTECGMLLKSRAAFENHRKDKHSNPANSIKPVHLMVCQFGNCIVRLEDYRSHMEDHTGVIKMLYYQCFFCPYLVKEPKGGREQIKIHLHDSHSDELSQLVPSVRMPNVDSENVEGQLSSEHLEHPKQLFASEDNSQSDNNPLAEIHSEENDQLKALTKLHVAESIQENSDAPASGVQSSTDCFDAKLTKQTLANDVKCSVWSISLDHPKLPESMESGPESLEIITAMQGAATTCNNVITEYSSSPKIFDVRSVTPDSYAHLGGATKEQIDAVVRGDESAASSLSEEEISATVAEIKASEKSTLVSTDKTSGSVLVKILPVKLPEIVAINQGQKNMNLKMLQSSLASKRFVKLSDLRILDKKAVKSNKAECVTEQTDRRTVVQQTKESALPVTENAYTLVDRCKSIRSDSTTVTKFPGSVEVQLEQSVDDRKRTLPVSVLKSKNNSTQQIIPDIEPNNQVPHSHAPVSNVTDKEVTTHPLLCNIPRPPPLAKIPQSLLEVSLSKVEVEENDPQETNVSPPRSIAKLRQRQKRPWRMALNGPIYTSELINYNCHLCGEFINTSWSVLRRHFSSRHSDDYKLSIVTPRLLQMSSDFISEGYKEVLGSRKRKSDPIFPSSKRRKRWNPRKHIDNHSLGPGLCVRQESVQDGEGNFVCKKCDQRCNDISSLRTHIGTNHRIKDHYLVCLECGENFVVEPSLQMHLKAFHRIQDPCTYMAENTGYARKLPEIGESESSTGIANQCHVCMAVFEDKLAVDKHLRVHGMAFLNRKRIEAQNAARNPDQKSKIDKPEVSLATAAPKNDELVHRKLGETEPLNGTLCELQQTYIDGTNS